MSGVYDMRRFMDGFSDENFYYNNPVDYIGGMTRSRAHRQRSAARTCTSPPAPALGTPGALLPICRAHCSLKGIHHSLDDWGPLGGHDWPYWKHMMREYLGNLTALFSRVPGAGWGRVPGLGAGGAGCRVRGGGRVPGPGRWGGEN